MGLLKNAMGHMSSVLYKDADSIFLNNVEIPALVSDPAESPGPGSFGPVEPGLIKRIVSVRKSEIPHVPREGDRIELSLTPDSPGDCWTVDRVVDLWHEYDIHLERYTG